MNRFALIVLTSLGCAIPILGGGQAVAQRIVNVSPDIDAQSVASDVSISGQFDTSDGTAVDINSVKIYVNGQDVTRRSTITQNFFSYRPTQPLSPGEVDVRVEYANTQGVRRVATWDFQVQQPRTALDISSMTHNATSGPLGPDATLLATINGTPGATASVLLIEDGETVQELDAQEVSPGVYVATLIVDEGDRLNEGILVGRLQRQGQTTYAVASQSVAFDPSADGVVAAPQTVDDDVSETEETESPGSTEMATLPLEPQFTSHDSGDTIRGDSFTIVGKTRPNASVDINVDASASVLGLVNLGGTVLDRTITADDDGEFEVRVPVPRIATSGTEYTITAVASLDGETSNPAELILTQE